MIFVLEYPHIVSGNLRGGCMLLQAMLQGHAWQRSGSW